MATMSYRDSNYGRETVNLYCAQCESQIGIFENEWIRLTTSYARCQEKGTHFGTEVGNRTQVVPSGPAQRSAEGCVMAEVFCRRCSNMVGQYCKSAPDGEKQALVDQYFYKLSRTFLKDSRMNTRVDPVFGYGSDMTKPSGARSGLMVRSSETPNSRWANTPLRQSSRTPAIPSSQGSYPYDSVRKELRGTPTAGAYPKDERWEQTSAQLLKLRQEIVSQQSASFKQATLLSTQAQRLDEQDQRVKSYEANVEELDNCLSAQASRIVEQDELIKEQTTKIQQQQVQLTKITNQLLMLQESMNDLKNQMSESGSSAAIQRLATSENLSSNGGSNTMIHALRITEDNSKEIQTLRAENMAMKSRLSTIANAMGTGTAGSFAEDVEEEGLPNTHQVLGKRKRERAARPPPIELGGANVLERAAVPSIAATEQMPTPQSSDGGQSSPVQPFESTRIVSANKPRKTQARRSPNPGVSRAEEIVEQEVAEQHVLDSTANDTTHNVQSHDFASNDEIRPEQMRHDKQDGASVRPRKTRASGTTARQTNRSSKAPDAVEIAITDDEVSVLDPTKDDGRRITRAASRAVRASDVNEQDQSRPTESESSLSELSTTPGTCDIDMVNAKNGDAVAQTSLPTVQMASSVLGVNLAALIASSRALTQSAQPRCHSGTIPVIGGKPNDEPKCSDKQVAKPSTCSTSLNIETELKDPGSQPADDNYEIEILEDTGMDNAIDTSDDDDDDLMQTNTSIYDDNGGEAGDQSPFDGDVSDLEGSHQANDPETQTDYGFTREGRSMAPEPIQKKKSKSGRRPYRVDLDRIHLATPQMFTEAYAEGRRPRETRPPAYQGRERHLNKELIQLGLSEWIGKDKSSKEYRDAVAAGRAHWRNLNRQAHLWSRGLNTTLPDPVSALSDHPASRSVSEPQNMALSDVQNIPAPAKRVLDDTCLDDENPQADGEMQKDPPYTTRSRSRRSSMSLLPGLGESESQTTTLSSQNAYSKRKSAGRRQSDRLFVTGAMNTDISELDVGDQDSAEHATAEHVTVEASVTNMADKPVIDQQPAPRKRGRPRNQHKKSTVSVILPPDTTQQTGDETTQLDSSLLDPTDGDVVHEKSQPRTPALPKTLAQQREEAILLRDRLAKELMECEDIDL